jgi:hypothetical protein
MTTHVAKALIAGPRGGLSPLIAGALAVAALAWPMPAAAGDMNPSLEFLKGTPVEIRFYYDLADFTGFKVVDQLIIVPGGSTAEDMAAAVTNNLNTGHLGPPAIQNGAEVTFVGYAKASFTEVGPASDNPIDYWKLHNPSSTGASETLGFHAAPDTGMDQLTSPGSFSLSGPGGLDISFTAAVGTTGDALANQLASLMNAQNAGYGATAIGDTVHFTDIANGLKSFGANGTGIDYELGSAVPEPSSALLMALGGAILLGAWPRRRRAGRA